MDIDSKSRLFPATSFQDFLPGDEELPSARSQRPVRRSRSNSADRVVAAVPGGAEPSWAPSEQLRSRAQRHQQQVHAATKEAMVAEEEPHRALYKWRMLGKNRKHMGKNNEQL